MTSIDDLLATLPHPGLQAIELKLERVISLLKELGSPQDHLPPVVHVAGTNGKGSTIAFLRAMLEAAGYKVHVYTSPHLVRFNERIVLAGKEISDKELKKLIERVRPATEKVPATYFEATTAMAFLAFTETPADIVLLETGMGGRLDATNTVKQPLLTVITSISMDHSDYLGDTLAKIAAEKAGIIKPGVPCITSSQPDDVMEVLQKKSKELKCKLHISNDQPPITNYLLSLPGQHQHTNAAVALACLPYLTDFTIPEKAITKGLASARWPARLQRLTKGPLTEQLPPTAHLWLDGGHNDAAAQILADEITTWNRPTYLICGMKNDKNVTAFLTPFAGNIQSVKTVPIRGDTAHHTPEAIATAAKKLGMTATAHGSVQSALKEILQDASHLPGNTYSVLIAGSLYLAGEVLKNHQ